MSFIISVCKYTKNSKHLLLKSYLFVNFATIRSKSHTLFLILTTTTYCLTTDYSIKRKEEWREMKPIRNN